MVGGEERPRGREGEVDGGEPKAPHILGLPAGSCSTWMAIRSISHGLSKPLLLVLAAKRLQMVVHGRVLDAVGPMALRLAPIFWGGWAK